VPECGALPVHGSVLSAFGSRRAGPHYGIDLRAREGAPVFAVRAGRVRYTAANGVIERYGNLVVLDHGGLYSLYSHLASFSVSVGDRVRAGQKLGTVGRTAGTAAQPGAVFASAPPHLHLEFTDRWPVPGGGVGRLDPGPVFAELGIVAPAEGPIFSACGELGGELVSRASGGGLLVVALALWALARS
jgi:murein DD-endopeptidase MepM/ murein hydrolase activator NlpD